MSVHMDIADAPLAKSESGQEAFVAKSQSLLGPVSACYTLDQLAEMHKGLESFLREKGRLNARPNKEPSAEERRRMDADERRNLPRYWVFTYLGSEGNQTTVGVFDSEEEARHECNDFFDEGLFLTEMVMNDMKMADSYLHKRPCRKCTAECGGQWSQYCLTCKLRNGGERALTGAELEKIEQDY